MNPEQANRMMALINERDQLRAIVAGAYIALDAMVTWMPSGFAPQSKAEAMSKAHAVMGTIRKLDLIPPEPKNSAYDAAMMALALSTAAQRRTDPDTK